jgi:SAM-dependent methyltransferase
MTTRVNAVIETLAAPYRGTMTQQELLDYVTEDVMAIVSPRELLLHNIAVYNATADAYAKNPHQQGIIDQLIDFMYMLPHNSEVIDIGSGHGRDTLFMAHCDPAFRVSHMQREKHGVTTAQRYNIPTSNFMVTALDISANMIAQTKIAYDAIKKSHVRLRDIHTITDDFLGDKVKGTFDGIWSCASLFTHTPHQLLQPTMRKVASLLKPGGIFFTSYTTRTHKERYDKFLASSSGGVRYYSQPTAEEIATLARDHSLTLRSTGFDDLIINGKTIQRNRFVNQFFVKE